MKSNPIPLVPLRSIYQDQNGREEIEILTTGNSLFTEIRGTRFSGSDFDGLSPEVNGGAFALHHGYLCDCSFMVRIPVRLIAPEGLRMAVVEAGVELGAPAFNGGLDKELVTTRMVQPEFDIRSVGTTGWFEDELLSLKEQLPEGFHLEICFSCGLSDYSPYGHGCFGGLACFREVAGKYRAVDSKEKMLKMLDLVTEVVQETHYCDHFEPRPKGRGYRG